MADPANPSVRHYRFCGPITGIAHEAYVLLGAEDTSFELDLDTDYCIIVKVGNDGGMAAQGDFQLEVEVDGGGFNPVDATSSNIRTTASGDTDNATGAPERLSTSAQTYQNSIIDEVDGLLAQNINGGQEFEFYYAFNVRSAELSGGESLEFRLLTGGATFTHNLALNATVAAGTDNNIADLPAQTLTLTANVPNAVTTEKNIAVLAAAVLTLTAFVPIAETFDPNTSQLPAQTLTLTSFAGEAVTTEADNNLSQLPSAVLTLTPNSPDTVVTEKHIAELPPATLTLTPNAPDTVVTEKHIATLPSATLTLTPNVPDAVVTEKHIAELPAQTLTLTPFVPGAITTEGDNNLAQLPAQTLTLTPFAGQAVTTEKHIADLPSATLTITPFAPDTVTTENNIAELRTAGNYVNIFTDEFDRAGPSLGADWTTPVIGPSNQRDPMEIATQGTAQPTNTANWHDAAYTGATTPDDQFAEGTVAVLNGGAFFNTAFGLYVRATVNTRDAYFASLWYDTANGKRYWEFGKLQAGSAVFFDFAYFTGPVWPVGTKILLEAIGTTINLYIDGILEATAIDSEFSGGRPCMLTSISLNDQNDTQFESFRSGEIVSGLNLETFPPQVETFDPQVAQLSSAALTLTPFAPSAVTSEVSNNQATLPSAVLTLTTFTPTADSPGNELADTNIPNVIDEEDPREFILFS